MDNNYGCGTGSNGETLRCSPIESNAAIFQVCKAGGHLPGTLIDCADCVLTRAQVNGAGVPISKLSNPGTGAAMHAAKHKLNVKHASAIAKAFNKAGLDWKTDFALAIKAAGDRSLSKADKARADQRIALWIKLLPYLTTSTKVIRTKRWKGKASRAAMQALEDLENKDI